MGKAILYCYKCSTLLREDDFAKGKAVRAGDYVACSGCAPAQVAPPADPSTKRNITSTRLAASRPAPPPPPPAPEPGNRKTLILVGGAVAALVVIAVIAVVASSGGKPAASEPRTERAETAPKPPSETPDRAALDRARKWAKENPRDLAGQLREFQNIVFDHERTPSAAEAQKEISRIRTEIRGHVDRASEELEKELQAPLRKKDYAAALKLVEAAGKRLPYPDWELARSKREHELIDLLAQDKPAPPPPKPVEEKKPDPPPAPALSEEAKAWSARGSRILARATAREHAAAAADLIQAASTLKDESLRIEAAQDVADLKAVQSLCAAALDALAKRPVGASLSIAFRDGRSVAGRILQIGPDRVELSAEKESIFAEWSDVTAASIGEVALKERPAPRIRALFCLLEGEIEAARSILGGDTASVAPRFWTYAETAKAAIPKPEAPELAARDLYYAAEREYRSMATRGPAVEKYARLKTEYAASALVKRSLDRIQKRSEAGREYFVAPADFAAGGTIRLTREGRLESKADSDASAALLNFAELEFYALPSTTYRCWILAGGCCQEVLGFYWQASELRESDPKTGKKIPVEPGGGAAATVKLAIKGLKPTHAAKEPKTPARWEWIELPLPRYAAPGPKKIRLLTDQQGFAIAGAVVSSTRTKPPTEAETKEFEKTRAADAPPRTVDPDLVGHWTFDEGAGDEAQDSSGNGHTGKLKAGASWAPGVSGSGLICDGNGAHVLLPNSPQLDRLQTESFTLAAWYKPDVIPPGPPDANDSGHGLIIKRGWHEGLVYNREARFIVEHWIVGDQKGTCGTWQDAYVTGKFYHVAGVMNRAQGKTLVYVNGLLKGTSDWPAGTATRDFAAEPWRIGIGAPGAAQWAYPAKGVIDDVRIYKRALTAEEIQAVFELTR